MHQSYSKDSLSLTATVAMGTGVMIGAGIFALTGQVAEFAGSLFPLAFLLAAVVSAFSAYTLQLFDVRDDSMMVSLLAVGLIVLAFVVNIAGNKLIGAVSKFTAAIKVLGIVAFAGAALWASGWTFTSASFANTDGPTSSGFLAGVALAVLAYKGFTTITNSGGEVENPHKNVGRAIMISLAICVVVYMLVAFAIGSTLTIGEIIAARDYSLAEAARPALGQYGVWFTVAIAIVATASGLLASVFAVSRMLAMLTDMNIIPHSHFGMPGTVQAHTLVYTVVVAALLAAFFDLARIASLGVIFYLVMDLVIHVGVLRHLRNEVGAQAWIMLCAIVIDSVVLVAFVLIKGQVDPAIIVISIVTMTAIVGFEKLFLARRRAANDRNDRLTLP